MTPQPLLGNTLPPQTAAHPPRLLDRFRQASLARGDSTPTADLLTGWTRAYLLFHDKQHPATLGMGHVTHFLKHVVKTAKEPLLALAMARSALTLLYAMILRRDLGELPQPRPPRVLDQLRLVLRVRHYSLRTEDCYVNWVLRFIVFHHKRHPRTMGAAEVEQFLTHLAVRLRISASSQNQAFNALLFFYAQVLEIDLGPMNAVRARRGKRLPVVLAPEEVRRVLDRIEGANGLFSLMARLLYGCGLRVHECCSLRVRDIDLARGQILVRAGKGNKDRVVMLPQAVRPDLERQFAARRTALGGASQARAERIARTETTGP